LRIYEGSPRQDFEEVFRSIGGYLDTRGMRDILILEIPEGFVVQGLSVVGNSTSVWSETMGTMVKQTNTYTENDVTRFMEAGVARRGTGKPTSQSSGPYERALRVIGRWIDEQKPRDVFLFEQEGSYVVRVLPQGNTGGRHLLAEFTGGDIANLASRGPSMRVVPSRSGDSLFGTGHNQRR
jgi:hypothetical protein